MDHIHQIATSAIRPHPRNCDLYKPVDKTDPDVRALAENIRENGILEPLVLTTDNFILSGHRRFVAAQIAGLMYVPCKYENIAGDDPEVVRLLASYNRQRVKSAPEILREEIALTNADDAYNEILQFRKESAKVSLTLPPLELNGRMQRYKISPAKKPMIEAIEKVLRDYEDFLPLTDRQIHYALLNSAPPLHASRPDKRYQNNRACYSSLCNLLTRARVEGMIPLEAIHDPTRPAVDWRQFAHPGQYIRKQLDNFLTGYSRNLLQSQPNYVEIVAEKNTLQSIVEQVAMEYRLPYSIGRGYTSIPARFDLVQRFKRSGKDKLILLILSDFDPEGEDIAHFIGRSLRDDFKIDNVHPIKVSLTAEQVEEFALPPAMTAKKGSTRSKGFIAKHGENVYELEAVPPAQLQQILRNAIDSVLDLAAFEMEQDREKQDAAELFSIRNRIRHQLSSLLPECGN